MPCYHYACDNPRDNRIAWSDPARFKRGEAMAAAPFFENRPILCTFIQRPVTRNRKTRPL